jgi:hypothetical protein
VPVAVNCSERSFAVEGFRGITAIETSEAVVTVRPSEPFTPFTDASIVVLPAATALARPVVLIVATEILEELHVA